MVICTTRFQWQKLDVKLMQRRIRLKFWIEPPSSRNLGFGARKKTVQKFLIRHWSKTLENVLNIKNTDRDTRTGNWCRSGVSIDNLQQVQHIHCVLVMISKAGFFPEDCVPSRLFTYSKSTKETQKNVWNLFKVNNKNTRP